MKGPSELALTLTFATVFFVIFAIAPVVESIYRPDGLNQSTVLLFAVSLNAMAYFLELYLVLGRRYNTALTWSALCLAGVYAFLAGLLRLKTTEKSAALQNLQLALSTVFITLAIAIRFNSHWISIAWFAEAAVLMTIGFWRRSAVVRWQALMLISITTVKVFAYDVWRLERGYGIVSFFLLGMLRW